MPKPDNSPSAVVVSGGKQYHVTLGDRILVDRLAAEPGSEVKLGRVLLFTDAEGVKVGNPAVAGLDVSAKVIGHPRGPRTESIRYKSKKRVRVHRGGRSHLTALEIIAVGGVSLETEEKDEVEAPAKRSRGRAKAAPAKKSTAKRTSAKAEAPATEDEDAKDAPRKATRRRAAKKETE